MTRSKRTPQVHKPPFDEENALRFAETEPGTSATARKGGSTQQVNEEMTKVAELQPDRHSITLLLKADTITALQHEAGRKGKAIDQIIDKLVAKHLSKNK